MAQSLDYFLTAVLSTDTRKRMQTYEELIGYLEDENSSLACEELEKFIDGLAQWVNSSNYKISLNGLAVLSILLDRLGTHFKPHVNTVLPAVVDRLGDNKDVVREHAQDILQKLMEPASSPQFVFDRIMTAFTHKLARVREEICWCLHKTLNCHGARSLSLSKVVPSLCKLLDDQSAPVREAAISTLVEIYRHVGERVRQDLYKKDISQSKLTVLINRMDEVSMSGQMIAQPDVGRDDVDFAKPQGAPKTAAKRPGSATLPRKSLSKAAAAGAMDEDFFTKAFEDVPKIHLFTARELDGHLNRIREAVSDSSHDKWEKRAEALKEMRSLLIAGAMDYDEFLPSLRSLEQCVIMGVKDLRSQVVREACVSLAYYSQQLGNKFDHFAEMLLPHLIALIPNSAKIMSTSGSVCLHFIIQYTHAPRLIPIITKEFSSKSVPIRRECNDVLNQLLHSWPTQPLERHIAILQEAIKKGLGDADSETRVYARKAFWGFSEHFREQADALLDSLDTNKKKMLQGELSNSSSNNSLNSAPGSSRLGSASKSKLGHVRSLSTDRSRDMLTGRTPGNMGRRATIHKVTSPKTDADTESVSDGLKRSSSAVDLVPHHGHHQKQPIVSRYAQSNFNSLRQSRSTVDLSGPHSRIPRLHVTPPVDTRPKKSVGSSGIGTPNSSDRSRPRSRVGVSQSQPSSRSGSPSSRLSYLTHTQNQQAPSSAQRPRRKSGIPRSQGASREGSPSRLYGRERKLSGGGLRSYGTVPRQPKPAQRVLTQGSDMEAAVVDALQSLQRQPIRKRFESYESDDASETSSVCSERSFSSYSRTSERELQEKLSLLFAHHIPYEQDVADILSNLSSASWADRKEGLIMLQNVLRSNRILNRLELKKITEIFTRMFHDPHGKVTSMFLETLIDFVAVHRSDLHDWLYVLLTRLLNKLGADMLGSVHVKVQRALEGVRDSFAYDHQFNTLTRFIIDQTQTPNLKVKVALLNYMQGLIRMMDPSDFVNSSDTRLAVSRIITWTTEPKSVDVRKAAQAVLIALFDLNTPEFSMMLSALPKTFQDGATKILHNHLRSTSQEMTEPLSPRNVTSPTTTSSQQSNRYKTPRRMMDEYETENMNPEDIYNSIRKASADIQNLSKLDSNYEDGKKERDSTSQDSGIQSSMHDIRSDSPDHKRYDAIDSPRSEKRRQQYNPDYYQGDNVNGYNRAALAEAVFDVEHELFNEGKGKKEFPRDETDEVTEILTELSNHNERQEERKNAMLQLIKMTRKGATSVWEEHFKTILLLLLETLGDTDGHIRALSLRVLKEILRYQPDRFKDYAELTILKILEAHKDPSKESIPEVTRAAEECAGTLANSIPPEQCIRVLNPIIQTADYPVNLAAIKMQTKVIENMTKELIDKLLPDVIPGLLKGYDNCESSVRKASVFCLVALYQVTGEDLRPFLKDLNGSKMKLLNLYIKRAVSQRDNNSASTSKTTSPVTDLV